MISGNKYLTLCELSDHYADSQVSLSKEVDSYTDELRAIVAVKQALNKVLKDFVEVVG